MTPSQWFCYIVVMTNAQISQLIMGITFSVMVLIVVGTILFSKYQKTKSNREHLRSICVPYRVVQLGDGYYALQHYEVKASENSRTWLWVTVEKYGSYTMAKSDFQSLMTKVIVKRAEILNKDDHDRITQSDNRVTKVYKIELDHVALIKETEDIDVVITDSIIDHVCKSDFVTRPEICSQKGVI